MSEEEAFAVRLIADFDAGLIPALENGATLQAFLSKKLSCSAMRISKKYAGEKEVWKSIIVYLFRVYRFTFPEVCTEQDRDPFTYRKQIYLRRLVDAPVVAAKARELATLESAFFVQLGV